MIIAKELIDWAERMRACSDALTYLKAKSRTIAELEAFEPNWAVWVAIRTHDPALLQCLATSNQTEVRAKCACNVDVPDEVLEALERDSDTHVRRIARDHIAMRRIARRETRKREAMSNLLRMELNGQTSIVWDEDNG